MNLLPAVPQQAIRKEIRARFLLAFSLVFLGAAMIAALALAPAEVSLVFFSPPSAQSPQGNANPTEDSAAITQTKALLAAVQPFESTSSLEEISQALSSAGAGISINDISYTESSESLTIGGTAQTPDEVNALRQSLQQDSAFSNVSVPVSALLGSQNGDFTITMNVTN